ncbi:DUF4352 domain-containing protein [Haladaptatus sp. T7]|uniref:DUF4352 domain-containing protein n=1 Tax=Haladaptatus sp. T7 TaxID=2029368 RepID=UPI0021A25259|nr:DUF4352 domain-containing protein [Haladaptatus sp. T7]GKZ14538.1 hypothetical protein HAL_24190 [Haladaptatus sp. T7]
MKRRDFIATVSTGIGISVAGCSSSESSPNETSSGTGTTTTSQTTQTTEGTTTTEAAETATTTEDTDTATTTERTETATTTDQKETATTTERSDSTTTTTSTTDGQTNADLTLGETASFGNGLEGTVRNFRFKSEYESGGTTQTTDQTFLFVDFTVANPTNSRKSVPSGMSIYVTVGGRRYDPTDSKGAVRSLYTTRSVEAGATKSGTLIFEVPKGTTRGDVTASLEYSGSGGKRTLRWTSG